jgi:DNA polymerase-3 subunit alpha (Gram-positive type)
VHYPLEYYTAFYSVRADDFNSETMIYGKQKVKDKMKEIEFRRKQDINKRKKYLYYFRNPIRNV